MIQKRLTKNILTSVFAQGVSVVIQLSLIPLYLKFWGKEQLGQWFIIQSVTNWLFVSDLGLLGAQATEMTLLISRGKIQECTKLYKSVSLTSAVMFTIGSTLLILLSSFSGLWNLIGINSPSEDLVWITLCLSLHTFLMQRTGLLHDVLRAHGNLSKGTMWNSFFRLAEFCVTGFTVLFGGKMLHVAYALLATRVIGLFAMQTSVGKEHAWINHPAVPEILAIKKLMKPSFSYLLFPLADRIKYDGTSLILGAVFGPAVVSAFNTVRTLSNSVFQIGALIRNSILPEFSIALAKQEMDKAKNIFVACLFSSTAVILLCSILLFRFGAPVYEFWTHKQITFDPMLLQILLMGILFHGIWSNAALPAISMNQLSKISLSLVISSAFSLLLSSIMSISAGYYAFAIGFIVTEMLMIPVAFKESFKVMNFEFQDLYNSIKKPFMS